MIDPHVSAHYTGDCRHLLKRLPAGCVQTCITSPPYWGLRDYDTEGQIGQEDTPEEYVIELVEVFDGVWRALADDGTLWLNLGDCYASRGGHSDEKCSDRRGQYNIGNRPEHNNRRFRALNRTKGIDPKNKRKGPGSNDAPNRRRHPKLKHKDLVGVPWMVAFALRDRGWYLRMDCIWSKPNPMPESVTDRPTKAHEYLFLLSKSASYYYDAAAIAETAEEAGRTVRLRDKSFPRGQALGAGVDPSGNGAANTFLVAEVRNKRSVWTVTPAPYAGAHFATFPPDLIEPCVLACSRPGDLVLDPFFGSGTTGEVAEKHERRWIGFDINPKYAELAKERTAQRSLPLSRRDG